MQREGELMCYAVVFKFYIFRELFRRGEQIPSLILFAIWANIILSPFRKILSKKTILYFVFIPIPYCFMHCGNYVLNKISCIGMTILHHALEYKNAVFGFC